MVSVFCEVSGASAQFRNSTGADPNEAGSLPHTGRPISRLSSRSQAPILWFLPLERPAVLPSRCVMRLRAHIPSRLTGRVDGCHGSPSPGCPRQDLFFPQDSGPSDEDAGRGNEPAAPLRGIGRCKYSIGALHAPFCIW